MNPFRAKRIADHFASIGLFEVDNNLYNIVVSFHGSRVYFDDEAAFWAFLLYLSTSSHHQNIVTEAQAKLIA